MENAPSLALRAVKPREEGLISSYIKPNEA
jgi:hypothetical protein